MRRLHNVFWCIQCANVRWRKGIERLNVMSHKQLKLHSRNLWGFFLKKMWWAALKGQNSKGGTQGAPLLVPSTHSNSTQNMALQVPALWTKHLVYNGTPGTALEVSIFVRAEGHFPCSPEVFRRPFSLPTSPFGTQYFSPVICRRKLDPCLQHGLVCHSYRKHFRRQFSVSICLLTRQ